MSTMDKLSRLCCGAGTWRASSTKADRIVWRSMINLPPQQGLSSLRYEAPVASAPMSALALAALVAESAAKAAGGLAVRTSVPRLQTAAAKLRPVPAAVRRLAHWPEVKVAQAKREIISGYIGGRQC